MNDILKRQKEHFCQNSEVHTGSSSQELEKYIDALEKKIIHDRRKRKKIKMEVK